MLRALASTKRKAGVAVNDARLEISYKRACVRLLEIAALQQRALGIVLSGLFFVTFFVTGQRK
jgi:hypothetical protein